MQNNKLTLINTYLICGSSTTHCSGLNETDANCPETHSKIEEQRNFNKY